MEPNHFFLHAVISWSFGLTENILKGFDLFLPILDQPFSDVKMSKNHVLLNHIYGDIYINCRHLYNTFI